VVRGEVETRTGVAVVETNEGNGRGCIHGGRCRGGVIVDRRVLVVDR
jgi:hypothetical protein